VTRRQGRRRKKLLDDLEDRRGYCQLMEEAVDRTMWNMGIFYCIFAQASVIRVKFLKAINV
jgi:hypothetical protein